MKERLGRDVDERDVQRPIVRRQVLGGDVIHVAPDVTDKGPPRRRASRLVGAPQFQVTHEVVEGELGIDGQKPAVAQEHSRVYADASARVGVLQSEPAPR